MFMDEKHKSAVLNLTQENWQAELRAADIIPLAKEKVETAMRVALSSTSGTNHWPRINQHEFDLIIKDVFFVRIGSRGFLLSLIGRRLLTLKEEGDDT